MVLPVYKLVVMGLKYISKPLLSYTKKKHYAQQELYDHRLARMLFIKLGNYQERFQNWVDRKVMKINSQTSFTPLPDDIAIDKGIELFYEIILYAMVITVSIYQYIRGYEENYQKQTKLKHRISNIIQQTKKIQEQLEKQTKNHTDIEEKIINHQIKTSLSYDFVIPIKYIDRRTHLYGF